MTKVTNKNGQLGDTILCSGRGSPMPGGGTLRPLARISFGADWRLEMRRIDEILSDDDCVGVDELPALRECVRDSSSEIQLVVQWLEDTACCDGTNNEAKLAAILLGLIDRKTNSDDGNSV